MGINHRMTDINKWSDGSWFRKLDPEEKVFWFYIHDKCDQAGVWIQDFEEASFFTGVEYDAGTLLHSFEGKIDYLPEWKKRTP